MFKTLRNLSLASLKNTIIHIFKRFPLSAVLAVLSFVDLIVLIRQDNLSESTEEMLSKLLVTLVIAFFFSIAIYIFTESRGLVKPRKCYYQAITLVLAILFYYFFEENLFYSAQAETLVYVVLTIIGVAAFLFISRFFKAGKVVLESQNEFYVSSYAIVLTTIMTAIVGIATMLLGFIAFTAVFTLFEIDFVEEGNWYGYWAAFSYAIFAASYFLANFPKTREIDSGEIEKIANDKFFSFLINFVGLPAIIIYFVILYAYTVKVLLNFSEWPQGEITWMVILFSFFGYIVYFASYAFENKFKMSEVFRKVLPIAVILQTPMLFYAIGLRIQQYDITINRYLVVVFGFWLFFLSAYFIANKKRDLSTSFYSLLVVVIVMSIGPWSVYTVPEWRQEVRLEENLRKANILQDGDIVPLDNYKDIDAKLSGDIYGGIEYLCNFHGCENLEELFSEELREIEISDKEEWEESHAERLENMRKGDYASKKDIERLEKEKYKGPSNWEIVYKLTEKIKVERWSVYGGQENRESKYLRFENEESYHFNQSVVVSGYDYYALVGASKDRFDMRDDKMGTEASADYNYGVLDAESGELRIYFGEEILETFIIKERLENVLGNADNYITPKRPGYNLEALLSNEDMIFEVAGEKYDIKLVLRSISIPNPDYEGEEDVRNDREMLRMPTSFEDVDGYVLIKDKAIAN